MRVKYWRLVSPGIVFLVAACASTGSLQMAPSDLSISEKKPLNIAVVIPDASRALSIAQNADIQCWGSGDASGTFGKIFVETVRDRFSRLFERVVIVRTTSEVKEADAIFEATLSRLSYKHGCMVAPESSFVAEGGLRSVRRNGNEVWRSNRNKNQLAFNGMANTLNLGPDLSRRVAALVEEWVKEIQLIATAKYAPDAPAQLIASEDRPQQKNSAKKFPVRPAPVQFSMAEKRPDDIAVIIGNANYEKGKDIPDVIPAYADAAGIKKYVKQALGIAEENIIFLKDASQAELTATFGSENNPRGQLFNYVKPGKSRVFVYYSGHGAPGGKQGNSYLVPSNAQASLIELNGYPLQTLYGNLSKIPAKSVTVVVEACFSGASHSGTVISNASPIYLKAAKTGVPPNVTVIAAGAANQIASWEQDKSRSLFTTYFLKGMSGEADAKPYGNGDGKVAYDELGRYLKETLTYYARRYYGREQTAQIVVGTGDGGMFFRSRSSQ